MPVATRPDTGGKEGVLSRSRRLFLVAAWVAAACAAAGFAAGMAALLGGCGSDGATDGATGGAKGGVVSVVAAENFWGSIAAQLGGQHADVVSVISNPNTDPHDYEPTAADARRIDRAQLVIENGVGYDPWIGRLVGASSIQGRLVLNVGDLIGLKPGDTPHLWYSPDDVHRVIARITTDLKSLDPASAAYFDQQRKLYEARDLAAYDGVVAAIRAKYAGTPIGASESIVVPLTQALGLDLVTPASFLNSISEGTEPTAQDKATVDRQIKSKQIKIYIYNLQNATPDIQAQFKEATLAGIPVVTITETLVPETATFQEWQVDQLSRVQTALAQATGR
jgi:zinc/manganese transport system substrate-binding protein